MSKEQAKEIPAPLRTVLEMGCLLMVFAPLWTEPPFFPAWTLSAMAGLAALAAASALAFLLGPALRRRPALALLYFLPLALPRLMPLFPAWMELAVLILPASWLLWHLKASRPVRFAFPFLLALFTASHVGTDSGDALERLGESTLWGVALWLLVPLWFCLRKPWRVFAIPLSRFTTSVFLAGLFLFPLTVWIPLSFKTPAEAETRDRGAPPAPRFRPVPGLDTAGILPSGFTPELLQFLHQRQEALREESLLELFANAPVPPGEMIRSMRVHGFLQRDPKGFHVPADAFRPNPVTQMAPDYLIWLDRLREHASVSPDEVAPDLFRAAVRGRILLQAFPGVQRFRLSADFRRELENKLLPRQMLTLLDPADPNSSLSLEDYARRWDLDLATAETELHQLADIGALRPVRWERESVAPPAFVPDPRRGMGIVIRLLSASLGLALLWKLRYPNFKIWLGAGLASVYGYSASLLAASAPHLPAAAATALWLTPPALLLLVALARGMGRMTSDE